MSATELAAGPFESLADLRHEHLRLLRRSRDVAASTAAAQVPRDEVEAFLDQAQATGARLDDPTDREAAQGVLDYWTAGLLTTAARNGGPSATPRVLAPFDHTTVKRVVAAAEEVVAALPPEEQELARRVMLRLVRLVPEGGAFEPAEAALADLLAVGDPAHVGPILDRLTAAGVIRAGVDSSGPTIALRSEALTRAWGRYADWLDKRARFRDQVRYWERNGRSRGALIDGPLLSDALAYHDLTGTEQEYLRASRNRESRSKRVWQVGTAVALALSAATVVGWVVAARRAEAEKTERAKVEDERAKVVRLSNQLADDSVARLRAAALTNLAGRMLALSQLIRTSAAVSPRHRDVAVARWKELERDGDDLLDDLRRNQSILELSTHLADEKGRDEWQRFWREFTGLHEGLKQLRTDELSREQTTNLKGQAPPAKEPLAPSRSLSRQIAALGQRVKALLAKSDDPASLSLLENTRAVAFAFTRQCTEQIVERIGRESYDAAAPFIREFSILYWSEMGFLGGKDVTRAMIDFREQLSVIEEQVTAQVPKPVKDAAEEQWKKQGKRIPDTWQMATKDKNLKYVVRQVPVDKAAVEKLRTLQRVLEDALDKELALPITQEPTPVQTY